jgi:hypothetical protein
MATFVRFENGQEGRVSRTFGPYPFVQLTYEHLKVEVPGDIKHLAYFDNDYWWLSDGDSGEYPDEYGGFSDVIIYHEGE